MTEGCSDGSGSPFAAVARCCSPRCWRPARCRADDVDVALVLVTDVSRSIDDSEFKLEKDGYATAFTNQKVLEAIQGGPTGKIAVSYVEFASSFEVRTVLDWTVIRDRPSAQAFLEHLSGRAAVVLGPHVDQRRPRRGRPAAGSMTAACMPRGG